MVNSLEGGGTETIGHTPMIEECRRVSTRGRGQVKGTELTSRQSETLEIIRRHIKIRGVPPSRAELAAEMGMSTPSGVDKHLMALARKGWVELHASVERGIQLLREGAPLLEDGDMPEVTAGTPILAEERREPKRLNDFDSFSEQFDETPDYFVRVRGDSLDKVGLQSGDVVAVRRETQARDGDLVVARIGQDVTLKRFHRKRAGVVELQPQSTNPEHRTIRIDARTVDAEIVGVVVGAIVGSRRPRQRKRDRGLGM